MRSQCRIQYQDRPVSLVAQCPKPQAGLGTPLESNESGDEQGGREEAHLRHDEGVAKLEVLRELSVFALRKQGS